MPTAWEPTADPNISRKPKIAIAIPYNGKWEPEWVIKTYIPLNYFPVGWCDKVPLLCKVQSLPVSRHTLVNSAIQAGCDYIFFIDTDIVFESPTDPNVALSMLYQCMNKDASSNSNSKDSKMVSGLYRAKQSVGFNWAMWMKSDVERGFTPILQWTGNWLEVSVTGLGCTLIDIQVFKNIPVPYFYWECQGEISEDFYFFELAKKHGYNLHVLTDVRLSHLGGLKVKSDGTFVTPDM